MVDEEAMGSHEEAVETMMLTLSQFLDHRDPRVRNEIKVRRREVSGFGWMN